MKQRTCKNKECRKEITHNNSLNPYCSYQCAPKPKQTEIKPKQTTIKRKPIINKAKKEKPKNGTKNRLDRLKELQDVFNAFIRKRDKGKSCISCKTILTEKYDAGHFLPVSTHLELRFNEDNVHGQCVTCNQFLHGNIQNYSIGLLNRIGSQRFENLMQVRTNSKLTIVEIVELIATYKAKINIL